MTESIHKFISSFLPDIAIAIIILIAAEILYRLFMRVTLRCLVREKLVDFLQRNHAACLPRLRAEMGAGQS